MDLETHHLYTGNFVIHMLDLGQINKVSGNEKYADPAAAVTASYKQGNDSATLALSQLSAIPVKEIFSKNRFHLTTTDYHPHLTSSVEFLL